MKIAIYTDYYKGLPSYGGGGETYAIFMALVLSKNHNVTVFTNKIKDSDVNIIEVYKYYGIPDDVVNKIHFQYAASIGWFKNRFQREKDLNKFFSKVINNKYDVFINASDNTLQGFANTKTKTKCIKINHFPWSNYSSKLTFIPDYIRHKHYVKSYNLFLCNSEFSCKWHKKIHKTEAKVLYPPICQKPLSFGELNFKDNIILCAGRIVDTKKTLVLARAFKEFWMHNKNYKLVIVGNFDPGHQWYLDSVVDELADTNFEVLKNVKQETLNSLYKKSKFFWSATGYKENKAYLAEHFGMTTVEAMANGCVPIAVKNGGSPEIITGECGLCYDNIEELVDFTIKLSEDKNLLLRYSQEAIKRSKKFLLDEFENNLNMYLEK